MSDSEGGFSFGVPAGDNEADDVETVEVSGEPVSRSEAGNLGYASLIKPNDRQASASSRVRLKDLPPDLNPEIVGKLTAAWACLKQDKIDEAVTLGQEAAFLAPDLVEPKLIIARCFVARRQYDKAHSVISAVPEEKNNAETLYYQGLCLSRLGKVKEALVVLKKSRTASTDDRSRKQANDLVLNLQGEQAACPVCGRKTIYDAMVEVEDRLLCAACAKKAKLAAKKREEAPEEEEEDSGEDRRGTRKRKKFRPPLTRTEILMRLALAGVIVAALTLGLYLFYNFFPDRYAWLRDSLPVVGEFLPAPPYATQPTAQPGGAQGVPAPAIPVLMFNSPEFARAMVGVAVRHRLSVRGLPADAGSFQAHFSPPTDGDLQLNQRTGSLDWTPGPGDGGKTFSIAFGVDAPGYKVVEQVNQVQVSRAPVVQRVGDWGGSDPNQALFMCAEDLTGDDLPDLAVFSGRYWKGELAVLKAGPDRKFEELAKIDLPGRPVGAGVVKADGEKWLAVADYWNSRLRFYTLRQDALSEMAFSVELPGRPLLASFHAESSVSAVLCQTGKTLRVVVYQQRGQLKCDKLDEWPVSTEYAWRRLIIMPGSGDHDPAVIAVGSDIARSILYLETGRKTPLPVRKDGMEGVLIDAALNAKGDALYCLWERMADNSRLVSVIDMPFYLRQGDRPSNAPPPPPNSIPDLPIEGPPPLAGLASCAFSGFGEDLIILGTGRLGAVFDASGPNRGGNAYWQPLQEPARLFGRPEPVKWPESKNLQILFADMGGGIWLAGVPES